MKLNSRKFPMGTSLSEALVSAVMGVIWAFFVIFVGYVAACLF
jgi:hypothetical protein